MLMMESGYGDKVVLAASREALKKLMNLLVDNSKKALIRPITINAPGVAQTHGQSMLRSGSSKEMISDKDIRIITE